MKKVVGVIVVLAALAMLPISALADPLDDLRSRSTLEDHLDVNLIPPGGNINDSLQEIIMKDSLLPFFQEGYGLSSDFDISLTSGKSPLQPEMKPRYVSMSSAVPARNSVRSGAGAGPAQPGSLDLDLIELSPDIRVRLKVSELSDFHIYDFTIDNVWPYLTSNPGAFSIDAEDDTQTNDAYQVGSEFQWRFTQNFGLFFEYRFLQSNIDIDAPTGSVIPNLDSDLNIHRVLGGVNFRF